MLQENHSDSELVQFLTNIKLSTTESNYQTQTNTKHIPLFSLSPSLSPSPFSYLTSASTATSNSPSKDPSIYVRRKRFKYTYSHLPLHTSLLISAIPNRTRFNLRQFIYGVVVAFLQRLFFFFPFTSLKPNASKPKSQGESYQYLLDSPVALSLPSDELDNLPEITVYDPLYLDNPETRTKSSQSIVYLPSLVVIQI